MPLKDNEQLRLSFDNFMKGHITRIPPERCPIDAFSNSQNISLNEKFLPIQAFGQYKYNATTLGAYPVRGGITYKTTSGTKYYVVACAGFLWYSVAGSGTFTKYQVTLNSVAVDMTVDEDTDYEFAQYNGKLYVVNGKYPIITNDHTSDHQYTTSRMIKITDTTPVGLTVADIPAGLKYIWVDKERLFGLNSIAQGSGLFWTNAYFDYTTNAEANFTPVSGANYDYVGKDDGESGAGLFPYQNSMFVFKDRNVYRYSTDGDITNWGSVRIDTNRGCPFNRTIHTIDGYLYWLSLEGIVRSDGTNVDLIDDNIRDRILSLPQLSSNSRQWSIAQTANFDAGTFGADLIDTYDNQLQQKSQKSIFTDGTFGAKVITGIDDTTANIRLMAQDLSGDWDAGTFSDTITSGNTVVLKLVDDRYQVPRQQRVDSTTVGTQLSAGWVQIPNTSQTRYTVIIDLGSALAVDGVVVSSWNSVGYIYYSDDNNLWYAGNSGAHRYWKIVSGVYNLGQQTGTISGITFYYHYFITVYDNYGSIHYVASGTYISQALDYGFTPESLGIMSSIYATPTNTTLAFSTRTSADGVTWDDWVTVTAGGAIASTARQYIQVRAVFTSSDGLYTPSLQKIMLSAPFISKILDYGFIPASFGNFSPSVSTPGNSSITYLARSSANADMSSPTAWVAVTAGAAIPAGVTLARYFQWYALLNPSTDGLQTPQINDVFIAGQWRSAVTDLGATPATWGNFDTTYVLNAQTITWWMRSATTSGGVASATFVQQTPGAPVTGVTLNQFVQVEIRLNTSSAAAIPIMESFKVTWYTGANLLKPCAYVLNGEYCLNVTDVGQTANNLVWRYNTTIKYFLPRTNKHNNVYFMDEGILLSGTSASDGFVRKNEIGSTDDGVAIDSWFITKNVNQGGRNNIFRSYKLIYSAEQSWALSYSTDNGATWTDITIPASGVTRELSKTLSGIVLGRFMMVKCRQALADARWGVELAEIQYDLGYEASDD